MNNPNKNLAGNRDSVSAQPSANQERDEVLKQMLKMNPKPHTDAGHKPKRDAVTAKSVISVKRNENPSNVRRGKD